jgi:hypothetical protein
MSGNWPVKSGQTNSALVGNVSVAEFKDRYRLAFTINHLPSECHCRASRPFYYCLANAAQPIVVI